MPSQGNCRGKLCPLPKERTQRDLGPSYRQAYSLQKPSLVLLLIVRTKLDQTLVPGKLAGFVEGDRVGAIQDVISGLKTEEQDQQGPSALLLPEQPPLHADGLNRPVPAPKVKREALAEGQREAPGHIGG